MYEQVRTGDTLLFSNNAPTGALLKIFVSSEWNHSGIAVRFTINPITGQFEPTLGTEGLLFVLETNTGERYDEIQKQKIVGAGFSNSTWLFKKYNKIAVRKIKDIYRNKELLKRTMKFAQDNIGNRFPSTTIKFIGAWLGISFTENDPKNKEMFCSEIMAHYYSYTIGQQKVYTISADKPENNLYQLFGTDAPDLEELYTPEHYTFKKTPNSKVFAAREEVFYQNTGDLLYIIFQPFILILLVILLIWITLPGNRILK